MSTENKEHLMGNANFPKDGAGRTYHLETKKGETANRILFVGSLLRAQQVADDLLEPGYFDLCSTRFMRTITGTYITKDKKKVPITICGTGMGTPMVDFAIREIRENVEGEMAIIRLGTCGCVRKDKDIGDVIISNKAILCTRNPDAFHHDKNEKPYRFSKPVDADPTLTKNLQEQLDKVVKEAKKEDKFKVAQALNGTCDSFYSSQGRITDNNPFKDANEKLIDDMKKAYPEITTLEMETFHIFDLCKLAGIYASSCVMIVAQRESNAFIDPELKHNREKRVGRAAVEALSAMKLKNEMKEGIWNTFVEKRIYPSFGEDQKKK